MDRLCVALVISLWPSLAAADVVMPAPSCPDGWSASTGHGGPSCTPPACEQSKCGEGAKCVSDWICVEEEKVGEYDSKWNLEGSCDITRKCPDKQRCLEAQRCSDQAPANAPVKADDPVAPKPKGCRAAGTSGDVTALTLLGLLALWRRRRDTMPHARRAEPR